MPRILVVEDEPAMHTGLTDLLVSEGHRVLTAATGVAGLEMATTEEPDLILLDVMMPGLDGFTVASELRRTGQSVPILILTAKGLLDDRVRGLDAGADDYLAKPFSTSELLARVRALLRRNRTGLTAVPDVLKLGDVEIHFVRMVAHRGERTLHFTAKEFSMLRLLAETPGVPVSRERFLDVVWGVTAFPTT